MSMTIFASFDHPEFHGASTLELSRENISALVTHADDADAAIIFRDDFQCGFVASNLTPTGLQKVFHNASPEAREQILPLLKFALANNMTFTLSTNDNRLHCGAKPELKLDEELADEPLIRWSGSHFIGVFNKLGFKAVADAANEYRAEEVLTALSSHGHNIYNDERNILSKIARYAISKAGPDATVIAV